MKNVKILSKAFGLIMLNLLILAFAACDPQTIQLKPEETEVTYTVEHYLQKVSGQGYEAEPVLTESLKGMPGANTDARAKDYEGFKAQPFVQQKLEQNKTTVIKIYYNRKTIVYTFDAGEGQFADGESSKISTGLYGASVIIPDNPQKEGFDFTKWDEIVPDTFGAENRTFAAEWAQKTSQGGGNDSGQGQEENPGQGEDATAEYTVVYYTQNKFDDEYSRYSSDIFTGKIGENTNALAPDLPGFTAKTFNQEKIAEDGSTIVKIYYDRKIIKYTFNAGEGHFDDGSNTLILSGRYEASVPTQERPSRSGYDFEKWDSTVPYEFGEEELTFNACWKFGADTPYKIIYWEQNISDNDYTKANEYPMTAPAGEEVTDEPSTKTGFTAKPVTPVTVKADGSTVLNVYYDRNLITYTFDADGGNWNGSTADFVVKGRYGADVTVPANPVKAGYEFFDWDYTIPQKFGDKDITFKAWWSAKSGIPYTVKYWKQNVDDDEYAYFDSEDKTGTAGQKTNVDASDGYMGSGFTRKDFEQEIIAGDGSTVVNIYYDRKIINYTFGLNGGKWQDGSEGNLVISGKYGASVSKPADPLHDDEDEYREFDKWKLGSYGEANDYLTTFDSSDKTFNALWKKVEKNYTVKHLQQNAENDEYTEVESETKSGYVSELTNAVGKTYTGFTRQDFEQKKIALDGSTVVNIYYDRNNIEYTFQVNGGSLTDNSSVTKRYGLPLDRPTDPTKTNYTFRNWYSDSTFENLYDFNSTPSKNTTIYAGWNYHGEVAKTGITIGTTNFENTEEVYVIDRAKTGDDITVVQGKPYISSVTYGPFREGRTNSLSPFIMGKYEVTQELYYAVMKDQVFTINGTDYILNASPFECLETGTYPIAQGEQQSLRPADNITWYDAVFFCNKLTEKLGGNLTPAYTISDSKINDDGNIIYATVDSNGHITFAPVTYNKNASGYRLPTETEWEFAFRGGNPLAEEWDYLFSGSPSQEDVKYTAEVNTGLDTVGWYKNNAGTGTHQVGLKSPNILGICDMSGNVSEWCYDWQCLMDTGAFTDFTGGNSGSVKMVRGGSFMDYARDCTNYKRDTISPDTKFRSRGFRLARSVTQ